MAELRKVTNGDITYFVSNQLLAYPKLRHAFFTRTGGVSEGIFASLNFRFTGGDDHDRVVRNYTIAAEAIGVDPTHIVRTTQKHTDNIRVITEQEVFTGTIAEEAYDALITNVPGVTLTGFFADCQLIFFYDFKQKVCAVVHSGWRGVQNQIARKTLERMEQQFGCRPCDVIAVISPSICRRCFETDNDVPQALFSVYGDVIQDYLYKEGDKWHVDLKNITYSNLLRCGILPFNIDISNLCTKCGDESLFWSHRRQGNARGVHGGMIGLL